MKLLILITLLCLSFAAKSQSIYSLYFEAPQPSNTENGLTFGDEILGIYQKENNKLVDLVIEEKAIISRYLTPMYLSTDEINQNPNYEFKKNLLHGIDSTKGLEYYIENDTVYFGIFKKDTLFSINDSSLLRKKGSDYFLSEKKGNYWEVSLIYVKDKNLYLRYIDIVKEEEKVKKYLSPKTKLIGEEKVYIANPTALKFLNFVTAKGFYDIIKYIEN